MLALGVDLFSRAVLRGGSSPTLWTPLNLGSALVAWWDAQNTANITLNAGNVASWTDRKGGIVASQATAVNQPAWSATARNGKAGLTSDGTMFLTFNPTLLPFAGSVASTIAVAAFQTVGVGHGIAFGYGTGGATTSQQRSLGRISGNVAGATNGSDHTTTQAWSGNDLFVDWELPAGASPTSSIRIDGNAPTTASLVTLNTVQTEGRIFQWSDGAFGLTGTIQNIVCANRTLTTSEQDKLAGWESHYDGKGGTNLPSSNPYSSTGTLHRPPYVSDP